MNGLQVMASIVSTSVSCCQLETLLNHMTGQLEDVLSMMAHPARRALCPHARVRDGATTKYRDAERPSAARRSVTPSVGSTQHLKWRYGVAGDPSTG